MRKLHICLAIIIAISMISRADNVFLPDGNGKNWSEDSNWSEGLAPNSTGAAASIGVPKSFKKNKGWRNIHLDSTITVGVVNVTCGGVYEPF